MDQARTYKKGNNTHNVSATVSIRDGEWETVGDWMWNNRGVYNGLTFCPMMAEVTCKLLMRIAMLKLMKRCSHWSKTLT